MRKMVLSALFLVIFLTACGSDQPPIEVTKTGETVYEEQQPPETDISDSVTYEVADGVNVCLMTFTNNAAVPVEIEVNFVFDNAGVKEDAGYGHLYCLGSGETGVIGMKKPTDDSYFPIEGVKTEYTVTVNEHGLFDDTGSHAGAITADASKDADGNVTVTVSNTSDTDIGMVDVFIAFYKGDVPVYYDDYGWVDEMSAGHIGYWTFDAPRFSDIDCTPIEYDRYEITVNHAYNSQY